MAQSTVVEKVSGRNPNVLTVPDGQIATWHSSSSCCDEQKLGLCRRDSHSILLDLAPLVWVEGCCFSNFCWVFWSSLCPVLQDASPVP